MLNLHSILLCAKALGICPTPTRYWGWYNANDRFPYGRFALMLIGDFARPTRPGKESFTVLKALGM